MYRPNWLPENPCLKVIENCERIGEHNPPCRCQLETGHNGGCLTWPAATAVSGG